MPLRLDGYATCLARATVHRGRHCADPRYRDPSIVHAPRITPDVLTTADGNDPQDSNCYLWRYTIQSKPYRIIAPAL